MNIISNRMQVVVAGQVFEIPSEKQTELLRMLAVWQSISVSEAQAQNQNNRFDGRSLING